MKKIIRALLIFIILIVGLFVLTGCNKDNEVDETANDELEMQILSLNLEDNKYIQVRVDYPKSKDIKLTLNENNQSEVTIANKKKNYELKLVLKDELEDNYYTEQESNKEKTEYTEVKFADNDGYYYLSGNESVIGNVLIDTVTDTNYKYVQFELSPIKSNSDIISLYKEQEVQNILSSFGFRYTTGSSKTGKEETKTTESVVGQWAYYTSYVYTFNADGTGTYDAMGTIMNFTYEADGKQLSILYTGNTSPTILDYKIDGNRLIVTDSFGEDVVYVKK